MAAPTITTAALPPARLGFDYALAGVQMAATGGSVPYAWAFPLNDEPAGILLASNGKLTGVPAVACGDYSFTIRVTGQNGEFSDKIFTLTVSASPNGIDLVSRVQIKPDPSDGGCVINLLNANASAALDLLTDLTEIPFERGCTLQPYVDEVPWLRSYSPKAIQKHWPIQSLTSASTPGGPLTVGSFADLMRGNVQVAPDQDGEFLAFRAPRAGADGYYALFVTYTAGFIVLPSDLYEAFIHLALLIYKEKERTGIEHLAVGESTTQYTRKLPEHIQAILSRWRRSHFG